MYLHWPASHLSHQIGLVSTVPSNRLIITVDEFSPVFLLYSWDFIHFKTVFSPLNPFLVTTAVLKILLLCISFLILHSFSSHLQDDFLSKLNQDYGRLLHQPRPCNTDS